MKYTAFLLFTFTILQFSFINKKNIRPTKQSISPDLMVNDVESWDIMRLDSVIEDFEKVIAAHIGKVVYLDIWASWCGPCIMGHKRAKPFKEAYENENVVFLYISLDESIRAWENAAYKFDLTEDSYLIPDIYSSKLINSLVVTDIPRYVIFDKKGKIVDRYAPEPGSPKSKKLLDKYLTQ